MGFVPILSAVATAVSAGVAYKNGQDQKKASEAATAQAKESADQAASIAEKNAAQVQANADKTAKAADEATNRANQKNPDTAAILSAAQQSGKAGASGTMLTGPTGVDVSTLQLGKNTLLGS